MLENLGDVRTQRSPAPRCDLVMFGTPSLYGLERAVLDLFDQLRPGVQPYFLVTRTASRNSLPVFQESQRKQFQYTRMSDFWSWPRLGRPHSLSHLIEIAFSLFIGNMDVLRASRGCDAIYVPNRFALCHAVLAAVLFRLRGRQVVFDFHDTLSHPSFVMRLLHTLITDVIAGSECSASCITQQQTFVERSKLHVILRSTPGPSAHSRSPLAELSSLQNVVFLGQVAAHKGVDLLVDAFKAVALDFPKAHLHIVGSSPDPDFQDGLPEGITGEIGAQITYWGYRDDAPAFLKHAYVLVQPTRPLLHQETAGLAVLEAMAFGVPSIVFRSGAPPEEVVHGETGLVCEQDSASCLSAHLRSLLMNPRLRDRFGVGARERYEFRHTPQRAHASWLRLFGATDNA